LPQTSYMSLMNPYLFFGLGQTNNYIEEFYSGIPIHESYHYHKWICIIPNSQLIIIPYPSSGTELTYVFLFHTHLFFIFFTYPFLRWYLDLYINPSHYFKTVFISLSITMSLLIIIVGIFKYIEKVLIFIRLKIASMEFTHHSLFS
jgi:integrin alpha FG-GAP repeat containing protein 1